MSSATDFVVAKKWLGRNTIRCALQVAVEVPSIKATLSDREYQLITSIAGDNFSEDQLLPASSQWLAQQYRQPEEDEGCVPDSKPHLGQADPNLDSTVGMY